MTTSKVKLFIAGTILALASVSAMASTVATPVDYQKVVSAAAEGAKDVVSKNPLLNYETVKNELIASIIAYNPNTSNTVCCTKPDGKIGHIIPAHGFPECVTYEGCPSVQK